jgi:hypothetical protein
MYCHASFMQVLPLVQANLSLPYYHSLNKLASRCTG